MGQSKSAAWVSSASATTREVLKLVAEGGTNKGIAKFLSLSVKTVEKHRANLMFKLDLHNAAGLTAFAIGKGLLVTQPVVLRLG